MSQLKRKIERVRKMAEQEAEKYDQDFRLFAKKMQQYADQPHIPDYRLSDVKSDLAFLQKTVDNMHKIQNELEVLEHALVLTEGE